MGNIIVITGASGFIGKALMRELLASGNQVYAVVRDPLRLGDLASHPDVVVVPADFNDYSDLAQRIGNSVDYFYHLAWQGAYGRDKQDDVDYQFSNIKYSMQALHAAITLGSKAFIFAGAIRQYQKRPFSGTSSYCSLCSEYGVAKTGFSVAGRNEAAKYGIRFYNAIISRLFGPGDLSPQSGTRNILIQLLLHQPLNLIQADVFYDWTYIDDAARGLHAIMNSNEKTADYYIGGTPKPFSEIMTALRDCLCVDVPLHFGAYPDDSYIDYSQIDLDALHRDTGFIPDTPFEAAVKETAEWLKRQKCVENGEMELCES